MNFYKHHIGDYASATEHLTWDEDQAYSRLLRVYYRDERPIPSDISKACRLARAATKLQRQAVAQVLAEFFFLDGDVYRNKRADLEIEQASAQATANRKIAADREAARLARIKHESSNGSLMNGSRTSIAAGQLREPIQTPDSNSQTPIARLQDNAHESETHARLSFEQIKTDFPKCTGRPDWIGAQHACNLRIERDGQSWDDLLAAARRYANYCANGGVSGPQYVLTPAKFYGAADKPWSLEWTPPPPPQPVAQTVSKAKDDAAWSEGKSRASAIGFREPWPLESAAAYMTQVKLAETTPSSFRTADVSALTEKMRMSK